MNSKSKRPVKIVVAGDSIVTCAQLWYVRDDYTKPASDTYPYAYWWVLGQRLRDAYGYQKVGCMLRTWDAKEKNCALADMYAALSCRGIQFVGDLHSDFVHLNHYGHEMFADVLEALLTERDVRIWKYGPAARKGVGQPPF